MADGIRLKDTKAPTATSPVSAPVPPLPELEHSAEYVRALTNRDRLKADLDEIARRMNEVQARRDAAVKDKGSAVRRVLAGESPAAVRLDSLEADHAKLGQDRRVIAEALRVAEQELLQTAQRVKEEIAKPYLAHYRSLVRAGALAYVQAAKAMAALDAVNEQLGHRELRFHGGLDSPLPRFRDGDPADSQSEAARVIRELVTLGVLDTKADAALLQGVALKVVDPPPFIPPKPWEKKKLPRLPSKREVSQRETVRSSGVATDDQWSVM